MLNTQRVLRWQSYVEEYPPLLHYIGDEKSILPGKLSCLYCLPTREVEKMGRPLVDPTGVEEIDEIDGYFLDQTIPEYLTKISQIF